MRMLECLCGTCQESSQVTVWLRLPLPSHTLSLTHIISSWWKISIINHSLDHCASYVLMLHSLGYMVNIIMLNTPVDVKSRLALFYGFCIPSVSNYKTFSTNSRSLRKVINLANYIKSVN
ncbi:hypothetical protein GYH30_055704 [Glycine max]|nr:hypothetical protein GYH30_055704 [Glycine max]